MIKDDLKKKIAEDTDTIKSHKHGNSLNKFLLKNPKEQENSVIARLLMIDENEVEEIYQKSIDLIKQAMIGSSNAD